MLSVFKFLMWTHDFHSFLYKKQMVLIVLALTPTHTTKPSHLYTAGKTGCEIIYSVYDFFFYYVPSDKKIIKPHLV